MNFVLPTIIAVASGKGGVGKTLFSACLATLAAEQELHKRKVLLVDMDFGVKGLTFLYGSAQEWQESGSRSMIEVLDDPKMLREVFEKAQHFQGLTVIPSDIDFRKKIDWDSYFPEQNCIQYAIKKFINYATKERNYDFVVFDTGAGINNILLALVEKVTSIVVIVEPDDISITSAYSLNGEIRELNDQVYFVINKSPTTVKADWQIEASEITFLDPLPFDEGLHLKFARDARNLIRNDFRRTAYKRYVGRIAKSMFSLGCRQPTAMDYMFINRGPRFFVRFFGYGISFLVALFGALVIVVWQT